MSVKIAGLTGPQRRLLARLPLDRGDHLYCRGPRLRTAMALVEMGLARQVSDRRYAATAKGAYLARALEGGGR